eukprot:scaffold160008_cov51-Attheya_sp.AAC.2
MKEDSTMVGSLWSAIGDGELTDFEGALDWTGHWQDPDTIVVRGLTQCGAHGRRDRALSRVSKFYGVLSTLYLVRWRTRSMNMERPPACHYLENGTASAPV